MGQIKGHHMIAALAAAGGALAMLSTPVGLLEMVVTSAGISEVLPAAAPPLGATARVLMACFAGLMAMGVALAAGRPGGSHQGDNKMGFAFSKLTAFARGRGRGTTVTDLPTLRRADAHPDAPPRRPIFASQDFGGVDIFARSVPTSAPVEEAAFEDVEPIVDGEGLAMPRAPEPLDEQAVAAALAAALRPAVPVSQAPICAVESMPSPKPIDSVILARSLQPTVAAAPESIEGLTIAELAARFERGLARRSVLSEAAGAADRVEAALSDPRESVPVIKPSVLADIPPAPPVSVRPDVDPEIDEALRAALGTLRRMTANGR